MILRQNLAEPLYSDRQEWWPVEMLPSDKNPIFHNAVFHDEIHGV